MHSASDCRRRPSCPDSTRRASPCLFDTFAVAHRRACCHRFWLTRKSNSQGQLARRVFLGQFTKLISADSRLQSKILHDIPVIIMKAVLAFKALVKDAHLAGLDVTDYVAERTSYFQDVLKEMDTDMTLRRFFSASGKVACHPLARVSRSELSSAYTQWCQDTHHKPQQWNADNVTDALGHMETKFRTNRAGNSWQETFQLQPKNDVGTPEPGGSERFYWGIGIYEDVVRLYPDNQMPADNPMHATSRQIQQQAEQREATLMASRITARRRRREEAARAERAGRQSPADPEDPTNAADMATRFID